jgi:hypothetical protein
MNNKTVKQANDLRQKALSYVSSLTSSYFDFAAVLYEIKYGMTPAGNGEVPLIEMWGFSSWFEYVEHELGMHWGRAERLVRIHGTYIIDCADIVKRSELEELGITKLLDLTRVVTPKNIRGWIKRSKDASCCDVREAIDAAREGRINRGKRRTLHVEVSAHTLEMVNEIVSIMRGDTELTDRGDILEMAFDQYLNALRSKKRVLKAAG